MFLAAISVLRDLPKRFWMPQTQTNIVNVSDDDLDIYSRRHLLPIIILAGAFGFLGFLIVWLSLELAIPSIFNNLDSLLVIVVLGTLIFAIFGGLRNWIIRRKAKRGFAALVDFRLNQELLFWSAIILAIYAMLARTRMIPEFSPSLSVFLMGAYFLLATPRFVFGQVVESLREARLSMKLFLLIWNSGNPEDSSGHHWLKKAMEGVALRLKMSGLHVPGEDLFLGSSYSVFKGTMSDSELDDLSEYVIKPSKWFKVNWTIPYLLSQAKEAENMGFTRPRSIRSILMGDSTLQRLIQFLIVIVFGILEYLLRHFGFISTTI